jgi:non-ribosomal peptide synthetase component E (peptide arylation enzyme)
MNAEMRSGSVDRGLISMPMFHFGAMGIIGGLHVRGGTVVLQRQFDAADAVRLIAEERLAVLHLAPVMLGALLDEVTDDRTLESVHSRVFGRADGPTDAAAGAGHAAPRGALLLTPSRLEKETAGNERY